jgi:hypothetical protein
MARNQNDLCQCGSGKQTNEIADLLAQALQVGVVVGSRRYRLHRVDSDLDLLILKEDYYDLVHKVEKCDGITLSKSSPIIDDFRTTSASYVIFGINVNFIVVDNQSEYTVWYKAACALDVYISGHGTKQLKARDNRIAAFEKCKDLYREWKHIDMNVLHRVISRMSTDLTPLASSQPPTSSTPKIERALEPAYPELGPDDMPF